MDGLEDGNVWFLSRQSKDRFPSSNPLDQPERLKYLPFVEKVAMNLFNKITGQASNTPTTMKIKSRIFVTLVTALLSSLVVSCSRNGGGGSTAASSEQEALPEAQVVDIVNAVNAKDVAKVSTLLQSNPKLVSATFTGGGPVDGWPLLMIAAYNDDKPTVELLLRSGADVNDKNYDGEVALHYAASGGYTDIVQMLLDHNADINVKSEMGATPLKLAENSGKSDVIALLKQHGAKE
jgi:hypothetical protein